jgi:hypothetical protein
MSPCIASQQPPTAEAWPVAALERSQGGVEANLHLGRAGVEEVLSRNPAVLVLKWAIPQAIGRPG